MSQLIPPRKFPSGFFASVLTPVVVDGMKNETATLTPSPPLFTLFSSVFNVFFFVSLLFPVYLFVHFLPSQIHRRQTKVKKCLAEGASRNFNSEVCRSYVWIHDFIILKCFIVLTNFKALNSLCLNLSPRKSPHSFCLLLRTFSFGCQFSVF